MADEEKNYREVYLLVLGLSHKTVPIQASQVLLPPPPPPASSLLCMALLLLHTPCTAHSPPPTAHSAGSIQKSAMGKDRHIEGVSLPQDPFIWSCPQKRKWVDLHFPTEASRAAAEKGSPSQAPSSLVCPEAFSGAGTALKTPVCCPFKYMLQTNLQGEFQRGKTNALPRWHTLSFLWMLKAEINSL